MCLPHLIKSVDKTEKDQLKECFVQNVTQCYNTFITGTKVLRIA